MSVLKIWNDSTQSFESVLTVDPTPAIGDWLEAHPEATTTVQDGAVSRQKLASDVVEIAESNSYHQKILFDMQDQSQMERGSFADNVWIPSDTGSTYATGYIDIEEWSLIRVNMEKNNNMFRWYDAEKNYLGSNYKGNGTNITTETYANARYFVCTYPGTYNGAYTLTVQEKDSVEKIKLLSADITTEVVTEKTIPFEGKGVWSSLYVIPGETYTVTKLSSHNHGVNVRQYSEASPGNIIQTVSVGDYAWSGTFTAPAWCNRIEIGFPNQAGSGTVSGRFVESTYENSQLKLVAENFTPEIYEVLADGLGLSGDKDPSEIYYNCTKYGVLPGNEDNTAALNALITTVNAAGGGVIWIPCGTYNFKKEASTSAMSGNAQNNVYLKNGVSILGENIENTVLALNGATQTGCSLFGYFSGDNSNQPLVGCSFSNFTIDLSGQTMQTYTHKAKAFYISGIKDCVFRDLKLLGTPSTALGIDMLDNVVIDSIYCYNCGNRWASGGNGGAAIGIGTGKWANENYIIRNCVIDTCGHFGIFLEDQSIFSGSSPKPRNYSKGQIIANNVIRNGRNFGIGLRGGQNVLITGNNIYSCVGGIYTDYGAKYAMFSNNLVQGCTGAAFEYGNESTDYACEDCVVINNAFIGNGTGIKKTLTPTRPIEQNNVFIGNTTDNA